MEMTMHYADSIRLNLATGSAVHAFVRTEPSENRKKCLLLHGNPGTILDWKRLVPLLAGVADIAAFDMPGFGQSPRESFNAESLSLDRLANFVIAVADALSWTEPFFIIGQSHGGGIAQVAAARYPERVAGIVPISTLTARKHGSYRVLSLPCAEAALHLAGFIIRSPTLRPIGRFIARGVTKVIFSPEPVPNDHALVPLNYVKALHELIVGVGGQSELRIVSGAGHMVADYQASEVAACITQFLSR